MSKNSTLISFRLRPEVAEALSIAAEARETTAGKLAKDLVIDALGDQKTAVVVERLEEVCQVIAELRGDFETCQERLSVLSEALLVHAGRVEKEKARSFVQEVFGTTPIHDPKGPDHE
jgi:hypothetical protein